MNQIQDDLDAVQAAVIELTALFERSAKAKSPKDQAALDKQFTTFREKKLPALTNNAFRLFGSALINLDRIASAMEKRHD